MTWWQIRADLGEGRQFLFGVRAEDNAAACDKAGDLLAGIPGFRVALLDSREVPPPEDRLIV